MKLIIADDEKWVRTAVKTLIPFEKLGITLASEASNGIEALELCRQHEPDILVTDIMMPGLTGLELIKEIKQLMPMIKIVIISGYNDFEYARTAMKYGITDYLLKPVEENELIQVLERIRNEIGEQARLSRAMEAGEEQVRRALPVMCDAFLNQLISRNSMTAEKIRSELQKYQLQMPNNTFTICVTAPDGAIDEEAGRNRYERYRILVKRTMRRYAGAITFSLSQDKNTMVSILNNEATEGIRKAFRICSLILDKKLGLGISAGISNPTHQLGMLSDIYAKASIALESRFWEGGGTIAIYHSELFSDDKYLTLSEEMLNKIALNLKLSNLQTAVSYVEGLCTAMKKNDHNLKPAAAKEFFWQFLQSVLTMLNIQLPFIRNETLITGIHPYERIRSAVFITDLESCLKELLQRIYDFYHDKNPLDNNNLVENAKKIIEKNFAGDISLEQVAKHVHLSPAYLSELFKKETGMSFIDYKTIIRIEHAKKLLEAPSTSISEISGKVGYSDPKYFSKLFKKITGKTIFEYRKEIR